MSDRDISDNAQIGDTMTLDALIGRSLIRADFVVVLPHENVVTALYRKPDSPLAELWRARRPSDLLLRFEFIVDIRHYPKFL